jgi:hypothetical protein
MDQLMRQERQASRGEGTEHPAPEKQARPQDEGVGPEFSGCRICGGVSVDPDLRKVQVRE